MDSAAQHTAPKAIWFDDIDSTNAEAGRRLSDGTLEQAWLIARRQSAGKGRQERPWNSPIGNFMGTYCWPIGAHLEAVQGLSLGIGLAVRDAIMQVFTGPEDVRCKWPNDILIGKAKTCGILIESQKAKSGEFWGFLGIGVNLVETTAPDGRPTAHIGQGASPPLTPEVFLEILSPRVEQAIAQWPPANRAGFQTEWQVHAYGLGENVNLSDGRQGRFEGIEPSGEAIIKLETGEICQVQAGDVTFPSLAGGA